MGSATKLLEAVTEAELADDDPCLDHVLALACLHTRYGLPSRELLSKAKQLTALTRPSDNNVLHSVLACGTDVDCLVNKDTVGEGDGGGWSRQTQAGGAPTLPLTPPSSPEINRTGKDEFSAVFQRLVARLKATHNGQTPHRIMRKERSRAANLDNISLRDAMLEVWWRCI
ncbi:Uncharacterized protein PBTT_01178 [Plasmodiophora brassicae]|uniref:Uncharacterized protein n=1 Tax=Plasmodiophora brassicae TaxID=37360 RepID=A0A0G4IYX7_PLABS|nr:hypothetical protein PBRA_001618 [Plasmodiophora brassicae]SPQ93943.1 unnamed protein product [Plasmodiophora brassicae]